VRKPHVWPFFYALQDADIYQFIMHIVLAILPKQSDVRTKRPQSLKNQGGTHMKMNYEGKQRKDVPSFF